MYKRSSRCDCWPHKKLPLQSTRAQSAMSSLTPNPSLPYGPQRCPWKDSVGQYAKNPNYVQGDPPAKQFLIKPPSNDPLAVYPPVAGDTETGSRESFHSAYQVPPVGLNKQQIDDANKKALDRNRSFQENFIGYQSNTFLDYSYLKDFLDMHTNNI